MNKEIHLPCDGKNIYSQNEPHRRWEQSFCLKYCGVEYTIYYCETCISRLEGMHYEYGYYTKLLHYLFVETGIFFPLNVEYHPKHKRFSTIEPCFYGDDRIFIRGRSQASKDYRDMLKDKRYELVFENSYNYYFVLKRVT